MKNSVGWIIGFTFSRLIFSFVMVVLMKREESFLIFVSTGDLGRFFIVWRLCWYYVGWYGVLFIRIAGVGYVFVWFGF